jgi:sigma-B regulation protein RsbU (phosphoserine phosphatase)
MLAAEEVMEAEASSLMLLDPATGELIIALPTGPARSEISGIRIPPGQGFGGWVVENRQPLLIEDASRDPRFFGDVATSEFRTRDLVCVPMTSPGGEVLGALQAINHKGEQIFQEDDVALLAALAAQAAIALERDRLLKESIQRELLENELRLASDIQEGFWPKEVPEYERVRFAGESRPARHVGGDYYDFVPIDQEHVALVIADVSGKGVGAALMMAELRAVLRARLRSRLSLEEVVGAVNDVLVEDTPVGKFATLFVGVLNSEDLTFEYVNAGHDPPLLLRADESLHELTEGGPIVGFRQGLPFPAGTERLRSGDLLVMFTDGVSETQRTPDEFFGRERLVAELRDHREKSPEELIRHIQARLDSFQGDSPQHDDITMVIARVG